MVTQHLAITAFAFDLDHNPGIPRCGFNVWAALLSPTYGHLISPFLESSLHRGFHFVLGHADETALLAFVGKLSHCFGVGQISQ
jgi:hypothetical protein